MKPDRNTRIAARNDVFRQFPEMAIPHSINGMVVITQGIAAIEAMPDDAIHIKPTPPPAIKTTPAS